eukprot:COSAG06_NODE_4568_length_4139_cov_4.700990_1_plen_93_part_00
MEVEDGEALTTDLAVALSQAEVGCWLEAVRCRLDATGIVPLVSSMWWRRVGTPALGLLFKHQTGGNCLSLDQVRATTRRVLYYSSDRSLMRF